MDRERLDVDVLFVGAGPACLSSALHLSKLIGRQDLAGNPASYTAPTLLVLEKGRDIGSHALSGAVVDPRAFDELLEGHEIGEPPFDSPVDSEAVFYLTPKRSFRFPVTPPPLRNEGCYVASLGRLVRWLAEGCDQEGIEVYPGFPAVELLLEGNRVVGARTGDSGVDRNGNRKPNFEPGMDVYARVTVLGEGPRGTLTGQAVRQLGLDREREPQIYALGVKEVWRSSVPLIPGQVIHTLGHPLSTSSFGGGFIYTFKEDLLHIGFVVGLDDPDVAVDCHQLLQEFKSHPFVSPFLKDGRLLSYGAKAIPEGGYYAMPQLHGDGLLVIGDSAGFLNSQRLKGIHLAVKSGMLAAETVFEALQKNDSSDRVLKRYSERFEKSWAREELWKVRNFRQSFHRGLGRGLLHTGLQYLSGGRGLWDPLVVSRELRPDLNATPSKKRAHVFDGHLTFDKLSDVFHADTSHEEDQPCHLKLIEPEICTERCISEYGNPCQYFCPASVYEMVGEGNMQELRINFSNCIHCKACEIVDPYRIILWTPPEGGGGPDWKDL